MGRHSFAIVDGKRIEVYRRVQAPRELAREETSAYGTSTRVTTGVPGRPSCSGSADTFRQALTIAKMRANVFDRTTRECEVVKGQGMRVLPREIPPGAAGRRAFWEHYGLVARSPERRAAPSRE